MLREITGLKSRKECEALCARKLHRPKGACRFYSFAPYPQTAKRCVLYSSCPIESRFKTSAKWQTLWELVPDQVPTFAPTLLPTTAAASTASPSTTVIISETMAPTTREEKKSFSTGAAVGGAAGGIALLSLSVLLLCKSRKKSHPTNGLFRLNPFVSRRKKSTVNKVLKSFVEVDTTTMSTPEHSSPPIMIIDMEKGRGAMPVTPSAPPLPPLRGEDTQSKISFSSARSSAQSSSFSSSSSSRKSKKKSIKKPYLSYSSKRPSGAIPPPPARTPSPASKNTTTTLMLV